MTAEQQVWIENTFARLEQLQADREQAEAAGQQDRLAEIDEEVATLTEALESVADDADPEGAAPSPAVAAAPVAAPVPAPSSPFGAPAPQMAAAPVAAPQSFDSPGMGQPMTMDDYADDYEPKSKLPAIAIGVLLLAGIGGGAFYAMGGTKEPAPVVDKTPQEAKVITAAEVPEDTQEPVVAKGGDADRTPGTEINQLTPRPSGKSNRPNNHGSRKPAKKSSARDLGLKKSRDPLSGV